MTDKIGWKAALAGSAALLALAGSAGTAEAQDNWCVSGQAAYQARDYAAAREAFTACLEGGDIAAAQLPDAHHRRGRSHMKLGDHAAALADFDRAVARDETHAQVLNSRAWTLLLMELPEDALPDAEAAKALAPDDARIADSYAHVLSALGRETAARQAFDAALELQTREQIVKFQEHLRAAGYDPGPSDGVAGPGTRAAIAACVRERCIIWK
ncbi:MAG: tetratricopeptide repeat protein [Rhodovibrionaceae bacterium]